MALGTLALSGAVNALAGLVFMVVGLRFVPKPTSDRDRLARQAFSVYWTGIGAYTLVGGVLDIMAAAGFAPFPLFLGVRYLTIPILCLGIGSLTFYFLYLFTGEDRWSWVVTGFYALVLTAATYHVRDRTPIGVDVTAWRTDLHYADTYESPFFQLILLMLVLPPLLGGVAYTILARKLPSRGERYRVAVVGTVLVAWSAAALAARLAQTSGFVQFLSRPVLGLVVVAAVLAAYRPPPAAQRWTRGDARDAGAKSALLERVRQLV